MKLKNSFTITFDQGEARALAKLTANLSEYDIQRLGMTTEESVIIDNLYDALTRFFPDPEG
jgi:hypothetical protein